MATSLNHLDPKELFPEIAKAHELVTVGAIYTDYETKTSYKVLDLTIEKPIQEVAVSYQKAFDPFDTIIWIRPLSTFLEKIRIGNALVPRFQKRLR